MNKHLLSIALTLSLAACGGEEGGEASSTPLVETSGDTITTTDIRTIDTKKSIAIDNLNSFINNGYSPTTESKASILVPILESASEAELTQVSILIDEMLAAFQVENTVLPEVTTLIKAMGGDTPVGVNVHTAFGARVPEFNFYATIPEPASADLAAFGNNWTYTHPDPSTGEMVMESITMSVSSSNDEVDSILLVDRGISVGGGNSTAERFNVVLAALTRGSSNLTAAELVQQVAGYIVEKPTNDMAGVTIEVNTLTATLIQVSLHKVSGTEVTTIAK